MIAKAQKRWGCLPEMVYSMGVNNVECYSDHILNYTSGGHDEHTPPDIYLKLRDHFNMAHIQYNVQL